MITELRLVNRDGQPLFNSNDHYVIPLYQRAYAWKDKHIEQLIDDINGKTDGIDYYLGALIVNRNNKGEYEVIDGQQRLTTLFLLFNCLEMKVDKNLSFACRDASEATLKNINVFISQEGASSKLLESEQEQHIIEGVKIILDKIKHEGFDKEAFKSRLSHVLLYRIELPEHTDLNRYFEIMNTRGEQLEAHDIIKARLMGYLQQDVNKRDIFSKIWDACSNMGGYVQMNMDSKFRKRFFGDDWTNLPVVDNIDDLFAGGTKDNDKSISINEIIKIPPPKNNTPGNIWEQDKSRRFESIISFPNFLLHVLRVFQNNSQGGLIDDKRLIDDFKEAVDKYEEGEADFAWNFIQCLLTCRYLFDKFILKRLFIGDDTEGHWCIQELKKSSGDSAYYVDNAFGDISTGVVTGNSNNVMLQSCMRVTYTSPKSMHWITGILKWLYKNKCANLANIASLAAVEEAFIQNSIKNGFLKNGNYRLGVSTPHLVFNYLDYLLWKDSNVSIEGKEGFVFEFRTSVEHWYPQNPSDKTFDKWNDVDRFGNLCIIQRNVNSRFGNMSPCAKKDTYGNKAASQSMIWNGSLKLRLMATATLDDNQWRENACEAHEKKMLEKLQTACNLDLEEQVKDDFPDSQIE